MRRREFIVGLSGTAALTFAARAQQAMPVIGLTHSGTPSRITEGHLVAFRQGLKEGGDYVVGQNVAIEYRWAEGKAERLPELMADLVRRKVNVIAAVGGPPSNLAAKNATTTIPVVFGTGADPIK
jgi:putative tryptophan/tyrosine transport system substrate-binding protein